MRAVVLPRILTVGRIVPNKRLEDVIRTLALLREVSLPAATLDIVGSAEGFERYRLSLERFAKALGVSDAVTFHGRVTEAERNGLYSDAGAYLCMSEHEGFCVPLIEALSQGLPVVARGAGAVPETLGGSGLILPDGDAAVAAEALALVLTDVQVRQGLRAHSIRRLEQLAPERIEARLMAALQPLVG